MPVPMSGGGFTTVAIAFVGIIMAIALVGGMIGGSLTNTSAPSNVITKSNIITTSNITN
jgi:hypothetical protein